MAALLTPIGGGIAFVWRNVNKRVTTLEKEVAEQRQHLKTCERGRAIKLTIIEILWQSVQHHDPSDPSLKRAKKLLDDVHEIDREHLPGGALQ